MEIEKKKMWKIINLNRKWRKHKWNKSEIRWWDKKQLSKKIDDKSIINKKWGHIHIPDFYKKKWIFENQFIFNL